MFAVSSVPAKPAKTQFSETLLLWRADVGARLDMAGAILGALLATDQIQLEWIIRLREASIDLLELGRLAAQPMARHPAHWLTTMMQRVERPRRFIYDAVLAAAYASPSAEEELGLVLSDINELHRALIELICELGAPEAVAGGAA